MAQIIAGIYEIERQIGAGGGGIVYLGQHLRLNKQVILKADRRKLNTKQEALRREVDMLKGLSHRYIPQVYDFVQENETVYTVMDFIEGESLDKILKHGKPLPQPQVIRWGCQLLEALAYLHSRPPYGILHGDIKPANIMLRPDGDICLIDYNIALALGEDGAVKVGFSRGYASPEHYGSQGYDRRGDTNRKKNDITETRICDQLTTETAVRDFSPSGRSSSGKNTILLDVRSDIYSLGATLYHLLSGKRPPENAEDVSVLTEEICSPAVADILKKAMEPNPDHRFQSAEEMREAFLQLPKNDPRMIRHRRRRKISYVLLSVLFLTGGAGAFLGLRQLEQIQASLAAAEYSANALAEGDVTAAVETALGAIPEGNSILNTPVTAQVQRALTDALGVYELSGGWKAKEVLDLPSAPFKIRISPDGTRFAVLYAYEAAIYDADSGALTARLPMIDSALADLIFLDENRVLYAGAEGVSVCDLAKQKLQWVGEPATTLAVSEDGSTAAAVNRDDTYAVIYRVSDGTKQLEKSFAGKHMTVAANDIFADPEDDLFALNEDGSLLAVSFEGGGLTIFNLENSEEDLIVYEESENTCFGGGFCRNNLAFAARGNAESVFGMVDIETGTYMEGYRSGNRLLLKADSGGIYVADGNLLVKVDADSFSETELAYTGNASILDFSIGENMVLTATDDACFSFYDGAARKITAEEAGENCGFTALGGNVALVANRNTPSVRVLVQEAQEEKILLSYDARYRHDEARISQDGSTVMLFGYQGFCLYDRSGKLLTEMELPDAEQIYDQQFFRDGEMSWLEVTWYDGSVRCYSAQDGTLISEKKADPPQRDLTEEFRTEQYRIVSELHAAPRVYDLESGTFITELETEDYLTYVTQIGEGMLTEYVKADGERYGLLLDGAFQVIASLPGVCDYMDGTFFFDDKSGNLRQCRFYSLQELVVLGETMIQNTNERRGL